MPYPQKIIVEKGSPEFDLLYTHSQLFRIIAENYAENKEKVEISSEFFGGDGDEWHMFVDLFFPEMGVNPLFIFKNKSIAVNPKRGTKKQISNLLSYMMVDDEDTMMTFARIQARKQMNAPMNTSKRGVGIRKTQKYKVKNYNNNYNNNNYNNKNYNNNNNGPKLGYTENEERYLSKLTMRNARNYFPNEGGRRTTRRNVVTPKA